MMTPYLAMTWGAFSEFDYRENYKNTSGHGNQNGSYIYLGGLSHLSNGTVYL
jgi:hypothetical protein